MLSRLSKIFKDVIASNSFQVPWKIELTQLSTEQQKNLNVHTSRVVHAAAPCDSRFCQNERLGD